MSWTEITRIKYRRDGLRYASDTTDEEWALIEPHMPAKFRVGRPRETNMRAVVDAIFYIIETGCQWRMLPKDFPPFTTVQGYFYQWRDDGRWELINHHLLMQAREVAGPAVPLPRPGPPRRPVRAASTLARRSRAARTHRTVTD